MSFDSLRLPRLAAIIAIGLIGLATQTACARTATVPAQQGHALAQARCGGCHAVEKDGASPLAAAPPFRTLGKRYPVESLGEALAEGISVGHPAMPSDPWAPTDIDRLVAYLKSIN
jgi:mono/diheme cytochrome c family protein